jgi:GAF domain-containing protein
MAQGHVLRLDERAEFELEDDLPWLEGSEPLNHSWLGAPMRSGGRIVGVISLQCMRPRAYGQAEEQLLQTIADQVAVAVERALAVEAL